MKCKDCGVDVEAGYISKCPCGHEACLDCIEPNGIHGMNCPSAVPAD